MAVTMREWPQWPEAAPAWVPVGLFATIVTMALVLLASVALEQWWGLVPCVLCQLQRCVVALMLGCAIMQRLCWKKRRWFLFWLILFGVLALLGGGLAIRHVWLQSQPLGAVAVQCLPSLTVLWHWLPWHAVLFKLVQGDGLCHVVSWRFLGLSLPMWLVGFYAIVLLWCGRLLYCIRHFRVKGA
jgi:protein dithiol:quinone oxidoreductase